MRQLRSVVQSKATGKVLGKDEVVNLIGALGFLTPNQL